MLWLPGEAGEGRQAAYLNCGRRGARGVCRSRKGCPYAQRQRTGVGVALLGACRRQVNGMEKFLRRGEALCRVLGQRAHHGVGNLNRNLGRNLVRRDRRLVEVSHHDLVIVRTLDGQSPREQLVQRNPDSVDVGPRRSFAAVHLLGRYIVERAQQKACPCEFGAVAGEGYAEIEQFHETALGDHDVRRFDVAVNDAQPMRIGESIQGLLGM